jgi:PAS domain S-box-containing protein
MKSEIFQAIIENAPMGYAYHQLIFDDQGLPYDYVFLEVNKAFEDLTGLKREKILERRVTEIIPKIKNTSFDWISCFGEVALEGGNKTIKQFIEPMQKWYQILISSPKKGAFVTWVLDASTKTQEIIHINQPSKELEKKSLDLEIFFNVNLDLLCITDLKGNFLRVNAAWEESLGYPRSEIEQMNFLDLVHPEDLEDTIGAFAQLAWQEKVFNFINRCRCRAGNYRYIEWRSYPYHQLIYSAARDISDWKEREEKITYLSFHDQLTGLYNRMFYEAELHRLDQERNLPLSLIMADVNGLKLTNDALAIKQEINC